MDIKERVLEILKKEQKPLRSGDIAEKLGVDKKAVSKALSELKKEGKVKVPKRCYYSI